ncbi:MAG: hypothetical protein ACREDL_00090, partial [Bradyrhizobium sp.]
VSQADQVRREAAHDFLKGLARHEAKQESAARRDVLWGKFVHARVHAQARQNAHFVEDLQAAARHRQGTIARLTKLGTHLRQAVQSQLRRARPIIDRTRADIRAQIYSKAYESMSQLAERNKESQGARSKATRRRRLGMHL